MSLRTCLDRFHRGAAHLQSPLLLVLRLYWGWNFFLTGKGKLLHLDRTADYFASLGIPLPRLNVVLAGGTECLGGLLLVAGLWSRVASMPLIFTLVVAYATAEHAALTAVFTDPDRFLGATPFLFLLAVMIVLAFGPGKYSLDYLRERRASS
ncbi:MAG: DoxX family protein [Opitutaceae bacterium]|nr:DoxX family protein [Opitutaceae bacterium]